MARETWQLPVGGYESGFPLVALMPMMAATISMDSTDTGTLDYISRHLQTVRKSCGRPTQQPLPAHWRIEGILLGCLLMPRHPT